jgi:hypothetical protein
MLLSGLRDERAERRAFLDAITPFPFEGCDVAVQALGIVEDDRGTPTFRSRVLDARADLVPLSNQPNETSRRPRWNGVGRESSSSDSRAAPEAIRPLAPDRRAPGRVRRSHRHPEVRAAGRTKPGHGSAFHRYEDTATAELSTQFVEAAFFVWPRGGRYDYA